MGELILMNLCQPALGVQVFFETQCIYGDDERTCGVRRLLRIAYANMQHMERWTAALRDAPHSDRLTRCRDAQ